MQSPAPPTKLKPALRSMCPPITPVQMMKKETPQEGDSIIWEVQAVLGLGSSHRLSISYLKCSGQSNGSDFVYLCTWCRDFFPA